MLQNTNEYLPIGTIVTLKKGTKKLMIFGIVQSVQETEDSDIREFDYIGVPYPEGNMGQAYQYLFNHEDIDTVYFRGFEDIERQEFIFNLAQFYEDGAEEPAEE